MRLTPKTIFFGLVALGLPFAVTIGWTLGTPAPPPVSLSAPAGLDGIGTAPAPKTTRPASESIVDWSPRAPKPVAVESSLPAKVVVTTKPTAAVPSTVVPSSSPEPPLGPPVPTPTAVESPPPSPSATESPASAEPELFWPQYRNNGLGVLNSRP